MSRPSAAPRAVPAPSRRALLRAVGVGALVPLAACGPIAVGGPEEYTPPPPGIDDLYREDLLEVLGRALAGTEAVSSAAGADPATSSTLTALATALPVQRRALLTGAELEKEQEAQGDPAPGQPSSAPPAGSPADAAGLVAVLVELRDLATAAARQISGSLARPVLAITAHTDWAATRLESTTASGRLTPAPTIEELVPQREVPETDPPSIGAESDYHDALERAQLEEWYAGYLHEVLASRVEGDARQQHLDLTALHRERAAALGVMAEEDGAPVVARQAVYAIPGGTLDEQAIARLPTQLAQGLLIDHIALAGAAPFERRPLSLLAALQEAERLAPLVDRLAALPSLEVPEQPPADG